MDVRTAEKIINDFGKVLEETSHMTYGASESLLPYKKELIKQALILSLHRLPPDDEQTRNSWEIGYISLANFIPDRDAEITAKFQAAIESGNINNPNWKYGDAAMKITNKITDETNALLKEVKSYRGYG